MIEYIRSEADKEITQFWIDRCLRLEAENSKLECVSAWRPIETAPRDGTRVLLYVEECDVKVAGGYWDDHPRCRCWIAGGYMRKQFPPTHWMPLPATPNAKVTGAEGVRVD